MFKLTLDGKAMAVLLDQMTDEQVMELRHNVLNEYMSKRVKSLIPAKIDEIVQAHIEKVIAEEIGTVDRAWPNNKVSLNPEIELRIKTNVDNLLRKVRIKIDDQIRELTLKSIEDLDIEGTVKRFVDYYTVEEVKRITKERLSEVLDET